MGITLQQVSYTYQANTPFEGRALFGVDLEIVEGSYTALRPQPGGLPQGQVLENVDSAGCMEQL